MQPTHEQALRAVALSLPRAGRALEDNLDLADVREVSAGRPFWTAFVIDGVTNSYRPPTFAETLASGFSFSHEGKLLSPRSPVDSLFQLAGNAALAWERGTPAPPKSDWLEHNAHAAGAALAFVLVEAREGRFVAAARGDACMFHTRAGQLLASFPMERLADFPSVVPALSTKEVQQARCLRFQILTGAYEPGDIFLLASDELSRLILRSIEARIDPFQPLLAVSDVSAFAALVRDLRDTRRIRDDDMSLVWFLP